MRRIFFVLAISAGIASQAMAATRVSVEQLEQLLASVHGQSDGKVAGRLADLELTERASSVRLARWEADFPGRRTREALTMLADASAFMELPAADMPAQAPPDRETLKAILTKAIESLNTSVSRLPNFYATRTTEHFEDSPSELTAMQLNNPTAGRGVRPGGMGGVAPGQSEYVGMHSAGKSSVTVSYRDGYELVNSKKVSIGSQGPPVKGLTTAGEFGPILSVVLNDAMRGKVMWGHWERGATAMEAVFRYSVAQGHSSYIVGIPHGKLIEQVYPPYHGEIAVDPATGDVLRISVVADFTAPYEMVATAIVVEYAAVQIGGTNYICPLRGVALSKTPAFSDNDGVQSAASPLQTQLNDVAFTAYHLFRGDARILYGDNAGDDATPAGPK